MTSVEELFRKPDMIPKRKLEDPTATFHRQPNKSAKLASGSSPHTSKAAPPPSRRAAQVEDEVPEQPENEEDIEAGPELPPGDGDFEDDVGGDDDEGRFFGGGVSKQEKQVLNFVDKADANDDDLEDEKIDRAWLNRALKSFEQKVTKNAELRAKYESDPLKFVSSEADLDAEIKGLSVLSEHGELYPDFVKSGGAASLVQLLAHENADIAIAVCEVLEELTDEDSTSTSDQWNALVNALLSSDIIDLLTSNLARLSEDAEADRDGVYHILSVVENLLSSPTNINKIGASDSLITFLISRIQKPEPSSRNKVGQNRQYSAELLAILLQTSRPNRSLFAKKEGVDLLLQLLFAYKQVDPEKDSDEEEFVENLFDCLTCLVEDELPCNKFLEGEGVELCLLMLQQGKLSKSRALKVLDHALSGADAGTVCGKVVDAKGLSTLFGMFMKSGKEKKGGKGLERQSVEHLIGIMASLLRYTPANSATRIRTLAKFVEKEYEKIGRLTQLRKEYQSRVGRVEAEIQAERQRLQGEVDEETEDEWLSRRLDAGLFSLQTLDVILSWLIAEDGGARKRITELLADEAGLELLNKSLRMQLDGVDNDSEKARDSRDMLQALINCL